MKYELSILIPVFNTVCVQLVSDIRQQALDADGLNARAVIHTGLVADYCAEHGIRCGGKTARQMTAEDYRRYDLLIGMDGRNLANMRRICGGDPKGKIRLLLEHSPRPRDIADPWYTGDFDTACSDILEGCEQWLDQLAKTRFR